MVIEYVGELVRESVVTEVRCGQPVCSPDGLGSCCQLPTPLRTPLRRAAAVAQPQGAWCYLISSLSARAGHTLTAMVLAWLLGRREKRWYNDMVGAGTYVFKLGGDSELCLFHVHARWLGLQQRCRSRQHVPRLVRAQAALLSRAVGLPLATPASHSAPRQPPAPTHALNPGCFARPQARCAWMPRGPATWPTCSTTRARPTATPAPLGARPAGCNLCPAGQQRCRRAAPAAGTGAWAAAPAHVHGQQRLARAAALQRCMAAADPPHGCSAQLCLVLPFQCRFVEDGREVDRVIIYACRDIEASSAALWLPAARLACRTYAA